MSASSWFLRLLKELIMSEVNHGSELAGESFDDLFQRACNLGVYQGTELPELPEYVRMRLRPILEGYCKGNAHPERTTVLHVQLSKRETPAIPPMETVVYQQDHGISHEICIEEYFYEEALKRFDIWSQIRGTNKRVGCFQHLVPFFQGRGHCEEVGSMASYDMIACTVLLDQ